MGEETEDNAAAYAASAGGGSVKPQSKPPAASPETVPPGFEPHRSPSPSPPPPGFESHRPPAPPPVSQEPQLIPVMSLSQSITQTREGNKDMDGGSVTVAYESPSESMVSSPETAPPGWEAHRSPFPPPPTSLPVSQESQLKPVVSLSQSTTQTRSGEMGDNVDRDVGSVVQESPSKSMASSPETMPPGWEVVSPPSPPPPTPLPVSEMSQLEPVGSSCQALSLLNATQTTGEEIEANENKDDGSVTVSQESPSKPMARLPETAPPSRESLCPPLLLSPPPPTPLPVSEESQLIPKATSSQALSLLNVAQTMGEETEGNEKKDGGSVTVSKESPSKFMASLPGTSPPGLESLRPPSSLPSPLVPTLFPASQEFQTKPSSLPETTLPCWESHSQPSPHPSPPSATPLPDSRESQLKPVTSLPETASTNGESSHLSSWPSTSPPFTLPDEKVLGRDAESSPSNHQIFEHSKEASSSEPTINLGQMVCGTCRALLSYPRGARHVQCPCCHSLNFVLEAHEICLAECGKCEVLLMYQHGAPAVRCSHCNHVTAIGEHNSRTLDSVLQGYPLQP